MTRIISDVARYGTQRARKYRINARQNERLVRNKKKRPMNRSVAIPTIRKICLIAPTIAVDLTGAELKARLFGKSVYVQTAAASATGPTKHQLPVGRHLHISLLGDRHEKAGAIAKARRADDPRVADLVKAGRIWVALPLA